MGGRPVWLASLSHRDGYGALVPSSMWRHSPHMLERTEKILRRVLTHVGDRDAERFFRMPVTGCFHRALTSDEETRLPDDWHESPAVDLAGGGVEIFWSNVGQPLSCEPCEDPGKVPLPGWRNPELYMIDECEKCPPCVARLDARIDA